MIEFLDFRHGTTYGLIYGIAAIGLSLPLRYLRSADLTSIGSLMVGGVVSIAVTNKLNWPCGIVAGPIAAGFMGLVAAVMTTKLRIPLMLAGIVIFTASQSVGLFLAPDGAIGLLRSAPLKANFSAIDAAALAFIAFFVALTVGFFVVTVWGLPIAFLTAPDRFVRYRHRSQETATYATLITANCIVGLAGALLALKTRQAFAQITSLEFLSVSLGAIFTGDAAVRVIARWLEKKLPSELEEPDNDTLPDDNKPASHFEWFRLSLTGQRTEANRLWFVCLTYILASVILNTITHSVRAQMLPTVYVPPALEHIVVASFILLGIILSTFRRSSD